MKYNFNESLSSLELYKRWDGVKVIGVFDLSNDKLYMKGLNEIKFNPINKYEFIYMD